MTGGGAGFISGMIQSLKTNRNQLSAKKDNPLDKGRIYLSGDKKWVDDVQLTAQEKETLLNTIRKECLEQRRKEIRLLLISLACGIAVFFVILMFWIL